MVPPKYKSIQKQMIPVVQDGDAKVHIISGNLHGTDGAAEGDYVKPIYFDIELKANGEWTFETDPTYNLFIYIIQGSGFFDQIMDKEISEKNAVLFESGDRFWVKAANNGMRLLLLAGKPLKEPVAWGGSIVMNTQEELAQSFVEFNQNTFIK